MDYTSLYHNSLLNSDIGKMDKFFSCWKISDMFDFWLYFKIPNDNNLGMKVLCLESVAFFFFQILIFFKI